jgi:hypothetical protein
LEEKHRARNLEELGERLAKIFNPEVLEKGLATKLRPTDVVITPYCKSGTTWTQQIVHTLRTRGDMDFDDISRVVPWIEVSVGLDIDLDAEQRAEPRAFKSHLGWNKIPRGGKYINVVRDPADAAASMFRFHEGWFLEPGAMSIDDYTTQTFLANRNYFAHLKSWWPRRNDEDVLFLVYEKMLADVENMIRRIAAFIGIELDDELMNITLEHSSREFMLEHKDRFDDAMLRRQSEETGVLPPGSDSSKVTPGSSKTSLSEETRAAIDEAWKEEIAGPLGYETYQDLITELE